MSWGRMRDLPLPRGVSCTLTYSEHSHTTLWSPAIFNSLSKQKMKIYGSLWVMSKFRLPFLWRLKCDWHVATIHQVQVRTALVQVFCCLSASEGPSWESRFYFEGRTLEGGGKTCRRDVFGMMGDVQSPGLLHAAHQQPLSCSQVSGRYGSLERKQCRSTSAPRLAPTPLGSQVTQQTAENLQWRLARAGAAATHRKTTGFWMYS